MKLLYCYTYGILGGVCTQLINRLKVFEPTEELDAEFVFTRDLGISRTFGGDPRVHFVSDAKSVQRLASAGGFDAAIVIDSPEFFEPLSRVRNLALITEVHTTTELGLQYLQNRTWHTIAYIVPSEYLRRMLRDRFGVGRDEPVRVVPNSIDAELFPSVTLDPPGPRPVFAWVGKLDDHKNFRGFLELAARITQRGLDAEYWLIGGETAPPRRQTEFIDHIDRLDLFSRCRWFPRIEYRAMHRVYAAVRASGGAKIVTSINESFGMSVLEAVTCGCPVLASRVGALPEISPGHSYIMLYELDNLDEAAEGAMRLAQPDEHARICTELDDDRTSLLSRYSREVVARLYADTLRELIRGNVDGPVAEEVPGESSLLSPKTVRLSDEPRQPVAEAKEKVRTLAGERPAAQVEFHFTAVEAPDRPPRIPLKVATIMDEFSYACFKPECQLISATPGNWREVLSVNRPDLLLVESAWKGNSGAWRNEIVQSHRVENGPLLELVQWCRAHGMRTVFWNKEDPPNFERFIHAAALFDYVFTTDANCIPMYRERLGHDQVCALPFAAQPAMHNPIDSRQQRYGNVCFAGTYYARRHADRRDQVDLLLFPALQRGLTIFDRMHGTGMDDHYGFPSEYHSAIYGAVPYNEMVDAYRRFRVFLNVNSVTDSPTMCSRRVFEILACGTPVISTYALGIERLLGRDAVPMVESAEQAAQWMDKLLADPDLAEKMVHRGQRRIFAEHTYEHRLHTILETIGVPVRTNGKGVTIVTCTNRPDRLENVIANYERQLHPSKELVLVLHGDDFSLPQVRERLAAVPNARVFQLPETCTLGQCLNAAIVEAQYEYWSRFDDDDFYGEHFIGDTLMPFAYSEASIVGKRSYFACVEGARSLALQNPGGEHRYVTELAGSTMVVDRRISQEVRFPEQNHGVDEEFLHHAVNCGCKLYSADRFNFVANLRESGDGHARQLRDEESREEGRTAAHLDTYCEQVSV